MCMKPPKTNPPPLPAQTARSRYPDRGEIERDARRTVTDRARARASSILTSGSGVSEFAPTAGKSLLGQ